MIADEQIACQRLSVLQLANSLGNVTKACQQQDMYH